jgi:predicted DNA-binding transcriptional regulator YafY
MKTKSKLIILKKMVRDAMVLSKTDMLNALEQEDITISTRTLERYLKELTEGFFIEYDSKRGGYVKNELLEEDELELFMQLLNVEMLSELITKGLQEKVAARKQIIWSTSNNYIGIEYLQTFLKAIEMNRQVHFSYRTQFKTVSERSVIPQFLKEYQGRWYLMGLDLNKNEALRIFGLDRIENLKVGDKLGYKRPAEALALFEDMIGVDTRTLNPEVKSAVKVTFKAYETLPNYFKSLPFHKTQQLEKETDDYTVFSIKVFLNYEFKQQVFMYSPFIEITEPQWLADTIKNDLLRTAKRYN